MRPKVDEYAPYYQNYIARVSDNVWSVLREQEESFPDFIRHVPLNKAEFAYAPGKWTLKEVVGHVLDTERIMAYRVLRIGRKDETPLPGFEENNYVREAGFAQRSMDSLAEEFYCLRKSNLFLFRSLGEDQLLYRGTASGYNISVRALLFIVAGHLQHHKEIIEERYLFRK